MMHLIVIFWVDHEGPVIFLLENASAEAVKKVEAVVEISYEKQRAVEAKKLMKDCWDSTDWQHQPMNTNLKGDVCLINLYPASSLI